MSKLTLINPNIHQEAKLKKDKFLERIKNVEQIRTSNIERNFLPSEAREWEILEELHKAINVGVFSFGVAGYKIFAFEVDRELYDWFRNNELQTIQKQVINWIAAVYLARPDMQEYLDEYVYAPILNEAKNVIRNHYSNDFSNKYKVLNEAVELFESASEGQLNIAEYLVYEAFQEKHSEEIEALVVERAEEYNKSSFSYINCSPPKFLRNPIRHPDSLRFENGRLRFSPHIRIRIAYFTERDWIFIVERDVQKARVLYKSELDGGRYRNDDIERMMTEAETDTLIRAESDGEIWNNWLYAYNNYEKTNSHVFRLFEDNPVVGFIYIIRQRNSNYFKIGWTEKKNHASDRQAVENRVSSLQTGNPEPLDIVGFFKASGIKTERTLHALFEPKRRTGEWFLLTETDWQNILNDDWRISKSIF